MSTDIYVNLPVKDLERSKTFFAALGFEFNSKFSNKQATCMIVEENSFVMLLTERFFSTFINKELCDASRATEVLVCLSRPSRKSVDEMVANAVVAGGTVPRDPQDHGFMYGHAFEDLDGHIWELVYMDPDAKSHG